MSVFMNPLPPQAYTKDTLVQAYAWLQSQSDSVKELATNPDILVSLFMKSKTQGDQFFERPSIQNFKNELKNLAGMIGEFEQVPNNSQLTQQFVPGPSDSSKVSPSSSIFSTSPPPQAMVHQQIFSQSTAPQPPLQEPKIPYQQLGNSLLSHQAETHSNLGAYKETHLNIDERSLEMIREVKKSLNLTSESEVLRLLISIGYQKARQLYK